MTCVPTDSRMRKSVTKQPLQRQVTVVKVDHLCKSRILGTTSVTQVHHPQRTKTMKHKLSKAGHACILCGKMFTQRSNMIRHLGCIHGQNEDGTTATRQTVARLRGYNYKQPKAVKRSKAPATKAPKSRELLSDMSSSLSSPPHPQHIFKSIKVTFIGP